MKDWRTAQTPRELLLYMPEGIGKDKIEQIERKVRKINAFELNDIDRLSEFDNQTGEQVLHILLEYACYSQNELSIELGRKYISFIPKDWLSKHIFDTVKNHFDYADDWNYRRLLELVNVEIPKALPDILEINKYSNNLDILECIEDYS